jgi:hypothetical protein
MAGLWERARISSAAGDLAATLRAARSNASAHGRSVGVVFDLDAGGWSYRSFGDGDGDGIRTADIGSGVDLPLGPPVRLGERWPGVDLGFPDLPRLKRVPPSSGWVASLVDPVQFGATDIVSFSPRGEASSGTIYLSDGRGQCAAVTVYGPAARVRALRYDAPNERWLP